MVYVARIYQYIKNQKGNDVMLIETKDLSTELVGSDEKLLPHTDPPGLSMLRNNQRRAGAAA